MNTCTVSTYVNCFDVYNGFVQVCQTMSRDDTYILLSMGQNSYNVCFSYIILLDRKSNLWNTLYMGSNMTEIDGFKVLKELY